MPDQYVVMQVISSSEWWTLKKQSLYADAKWLCTDNQFRLFGNFSVYKSKRETISILKKIIPNLTKIKTPLTTPLYITYVQN